MELAILNITSVTPPCAQVNKADYVMLTGLVRGDVSEQDVIVSSGGLQSVPGILQNSHADRSCQALLMKCTCNAATMVTINRKIPNGTVVLALSVILQLIKLHSLGSICQNYFK